MGDWGTGSDSQVCATVGEASASSTGTTITGTTAHTKGAWAELTASCPFDVRWMNPSLFNVIGITQDYLVDIGIGGAGSETVVIANLGISVKSPQHGSGPVLIPASIPAGTRIAMRLQTAVTGSRTLNMALTLYTGGFRESQPLGLITTYGASTAATAGVNVDPGAAANTKGAWTEITAATTAAHPRLILGAMNQANGGRTAAGWLVDIGVGAAASEVAVAEDIGLYSSTSEVLRPGLQDILVPIPEGSRIAVRAACGITDATDRTFGAIIYGVS